MAARFRRAAVGAALCAALLAPQDAAAQTEGEYLYNVTILRAAPGHFNDLIETLEASFEILEAAGDRRPFWMRHSQGDHWDFMLIYPVGDAAAHFAPGRVERRDAAWTAEAGAEVARRLGEFTAYREEWFARSVGVDELARRFDGMGLFHIEMFSGLPGRRKELLEQRRMENRYYEHLDRQLNVLFVREAGPNWDAMTIGFYEDLGSYAAAGVRYSEEEQDEAARAAGFESVGEIGPYLRSLLAYHNDTLAVRAGS